MKNSKIIIGVMRKGMLLAFGLIATAEADAQTVLVNGLPPSNLYFNTALGDKISLYGNRINATNMYGFGVGDNTLYNKTNGSYAWLTNTNVSVSDDQYDIFDKSIMHLTQDVNGSVLSLRENTTYGSANSGEVRCLEKGTTLYGGFMKYNGSTNDFQLGTYNDTDKGIALSIERNSRNIGIGTDNAGERLVVQDNDAKLVVRDGADNNSSNAAALELLEYSSGTFDGGGYVRWDGSANQLILGTRLTGTNNDIFVVSRNGENVGIGTTSNAALSSTYKLHVNGKIRAKEIVVETGWADFVFEDDYKLRSLEEVESFIKDNGHLPDVPSAEHVAENGVTVGEMEAILLQKVEELTLYVIEMKKQNDLLKADVESLKK